MPSKAELKQEIDNLRASLKSATERLTAPGSNPKEIRMITVKCPICKKIVEIPEYDKITRSDALKIHIEKEHSHHLPGRSNPDYSRPIVLVDMKTGYKTVILKPDSSIMYEGSEREKRLKEKYFILNATAEDIASEKAKLGELSGNPVCFPAIEKLESNIAKGKSHWDITNELYTRWAEHKDTCLPCEIDYIEIKDALASIGSRYRSLVRPEDVNIEEIAASVREQTAREIFKAESCAKALSATCEIKLSRVRARLLKMKPLAHVGRWSEFMSNRRQLEADFELDMEEAIPGLKDYRIKTLSYIVPAPTVREIEKAISLTPEERKQLEEKLTPEERAQLAETRRLAELGRRMLRGG